MAEASSHTLKKLYMVEVEILFPMLRSGAVLLLALLVAGAPGQGAVKVLGSLDPAMAAGLAGQGLDLFNQPVSEVLIASQNPDVLVVTTEAELSPVKLRAQLGNGRGVVLSNHLGTDFFEALGIKRGGVQLINVQVSAGDPQVLTFQGLASSTRYPVRVFWGSAPADTLYSLEPLRGSFDLGRTYGPDTVIAGMVFGSGYLAILPGAVLHRSDGFYAQSEGGDPSRPATQNRAFLAEAVQYAYQRSARGATATPSATPVEASTPSPATPPPTPAPTEAPATPSRTAAATPPPSSPPPAPSFPVAGALVVAILILVAVIVGARMRRRKPPPDATPGVGMGREEVPLESLPPPPPDEPPAPTS